jgi:hypothetical protein
VPSTHRLPAVAGLALAVVSLAGCDLLDTVVRGPDAPSYAKVEVWNTTTEPLFLLDREGRRLDVPACGHAAADPFEQHMIEVRHEDGYVMGFGSGGGATQYVILLARSMDIQHTEIPPVAIPPCRGTPEVQIGI